MKIKLKINERFVTEKFELTRRCEDPQSEVLSKTESSRPRSDPKTHLVFEGPLGLRTKLGTSKLE